MSKQKKVSRAPNYISGRFKKAIDVENPVLKEKNAGDSKGVVSQNTPEIKGSATTRTIKGREARTGLLLKSGYVKPVLKNFKPISKASQTLQTSEVVKENDLLSIDEKLLEMSQLLFTDATPLEGPEYDILTELYKSSFKSEPTIKLK